jgi:nitrite reductase/ring-hydroxylating ferredoxin subunit
MDPQTGGWETAIGVGELTADEATRVHVSGLDVLVLKHGETIFAVANRCTHQGAPLDKGIVKTSESVPTVTCPAHGSVFSLIDGRVRRGPASRPVQAFEVRVNEGTVEIRPRG